MMNRIIMLIFAGLCLVTLGCGCKNEGPIFPSDYGLHVAVLPDILHGGETITIKWSISDPWLNRFEIYWVDEANNLELIGKTKRHQLKWTIPLVDTAMNATILLRGFNDTYNFSPRETTSNTFLLEPPVSAEPSSFVGTYNDGAVEILITDSTDNSADITGIYDTTINWGDGSSPEEIIPLIWVEGKTVLFHMYDFPGVYIVAIDVSGILTGIFELTVP